MSTYEPGTVAVATVRGVPSVRIFRSVGPLSSCVWSLAEGIPHTRLEEGGVTDIRPLVVLDPQDTETLDRLVTLFHESWSGCDGSRGIGLGGALLKLSQPPRIPEPGLGSHVTAGKPDGTRSEFVRVGSRHWSEIGNGSGWEWSDLVDPILVRPGIGDES